MVTPSQTVKEADNTPSSKVPISLPSLREQELNPRSQLPTSPEKIANFLKENFLPDAKVKFDQKKNLLSLNVPTTEELAEKLQGEGTEIKLYQSNPALRYIQNAKNQSLVFYDKNRLNSSDTPQVVFVKIKDPRESKEGKELVLAFEKFGEKNFTIGNYAIFEIDPEGKARAINFVDVNGNSTTGTRGFTPNDNFIKPKDLYEQLVEKVPS
jgi:hypothetical protein